MAGKHIRNTPDAEQFGQELSVLVDLVFGESEHPAAMELRLREFLDQLGTRALTDAQQQSQISQARASPRLSASASAISTSGRPRCARSPTTSEDLERRQRDPRTGTWWFRVDLPPGTDGGRKLGHQSTGLKPRTVRYIHTIIHAALDDAVKWRRLTVNPASHATPPSAKSAKPPEKKVWTAAELLTFLNLTDGDRYLPWLVLATTGCRRGEVLGLRWQDINLDEGIAAIRQQVIPLQKAAGKGREGRIVSRTKGGDARVIELDRRTVATLRSWKAGQAEEKLLLGNGNRDAGLVFPRPDGRPYHPKTFSKTFDRRLRQARSQSCRSSVCMIFATRGPRSP